VFFIIGFFILNAFVFAIQKVRLHELKLIKKTLLFVILFSISSLTSFLSLEQLGFELYSTERILMNERHNHVNIAAEKLKIEFEKLQDKSIIEVNNVLPQMKKELEVLVYEFNSLHLDLNKLKLSYENEVFKLDSIAQVISFTASFDTESLKALEAITNCEAQKKRGLWIGILTSFIASVLFYFLFQYLLPKIKLS